MSPGEGRPGSSGARADRGTDVGQGRSRRFPIRRPTLRGREPMGYVFIAGTIVFTVYGQLIIRHQIGELGETPAGAGLVRTLLEFVFTRPLVLSGLAAAFVASLFWMATLTRLELSFAYPFMALNFLIVVVVGAVAFGEVLNANKIIGLLIVCGGLVVIAQGT